MIDLKRAGPLIYKEMGFLFMSYAGLAGLSASDYSRHTNVSFNISAVFLGKLRQNYAEAFTEYRLR